MIRRLLIAALLFAAPGPARAEDGAAGACPPGNLLAGRAPAAWLDLRGTLDHLNDETILPEGAMWNAPSAVVLLTGAASVDYDLGAPTTLRGLWLQADANDEYVVWGSLDGRDWRVLARVDNVVDSQGHGLRGRKVPLGGAVARWIRVGEPSGDGYFSISEIALFCSVPDRFPPEMKVVAAELASGPAPTVRLWTDRSSARFQLALALAWLAYLVWEPRATGRARRGKLGEKGWRVVALFAFAAYFNFGAFHFDNFIHGWDLFHYYAGGKYFRELGYERLYECIAIADAEDGLRRRVELRKHTDLRTNDLLPSAPLLEHPERCKAHFTDERWQAFREDVAFFRSRETPKRWDELQTDHGFNATPVWTIAGSLLANLAPASEGFITILALLDPLYLAAALALVRAAFGWRTAAIAMVVLVTNFPSRYFWTGGSFLRWDWLFYMTASVALLRLGRPALAGGAAAYATLLRVFPGFLVVGPILAFAIALVRTRRPDATWLRFFAGGIMATILLVLVSLPIVGGPEAYRQFVTNSVKHAATPLTNYMGLRTVVAYRPSQAGRILRDESAVDPWGEWKKARLRAFEEARWIWVAGAAGFVLLLGLAVRREPHWVAPALGATLCAVTVELTSYYYAFILPVALAVDRRAKAAWILLAGTAATQFISWAPLAFMPKWWDEQYTWMSVATLAAFAGLLGLFAFRAAPGESVTR